MIRVTQAAFDPGLEANSFHSSRTDAGAMVTFTGLVRSHDDDSITALILECYEDLARNELAAIREAAIDRFGLSDAAILHRYGRLVPGESIMMVITLAPHRQAAFDAAQFLMDYLKTGAPFWKQEETTSGLRWVEAKAGDDAARSRWDE